MKHIAYIGAGICGIAAIILTTQGQPAWVLMWLPVILLLTYATIKERKSG